MQVVIVKMVKMMNYHDGQQVATVRLISLQNLMGSSMQILSNVCLRTVKVPIKFRKSSGLCLHNELRRSLWVAYTLCAKKHFNSLLFSSYYYFDEYDFPILTLTLTLNRGT